MLTLADVAVVSAKPSRLSAAEIEHATDLIGEGLLSLDKASELLPTVKGGKRVSISALVRWIHKGKGGVKLEALRPIGGKWFTTPLAVARFMAATSWGDK